MPDKPIVGLAAFRPARQKTRQQKVAMSKRELTEVRNKNLAKARRVRKKNLLAKKKAAKT